jgi:hypothetical protein
VERAEAAAARAAGARAAAARAGARAAAARARAAAARAAAEGLELEPSASGETGFKGVYKRGSKYTAQVWENGHHHLGTFATPEEAALC